MYPFDTFDNVARFFSMPFAAAGATGAALLSLALASPLRPLADGCARVYVDVGTNRGVQLRKLFEPELYPRAPVLSVFDRLFGRSRAADRSLCAFGFEPNPPLEGRLVALEQAYAKRGLSLRVFTRTAASTHDGEVEFHYYDDLDLNVGSSIHPRHNRSRAELGNARLLSTTVRSIDLARFLKEHVHARRVPFGATSTVVVKLDVEGHEYILLPHLIASGALCRVNLVFYEFHSGQRFVKDPKERAAKVEQERAMLEQIDGLKRTWGRGCVTEALSLDDETYQRDDGELRIPSVKVQLAEKAARKPPPPLTPIPW